MAGSELQQAVARLQGHPLEASLFQGLTVTGTGFFGPERVAIRELASLCGLQYSGDLVNGATTHLVLAQGGGGTAAEVAAAAGAGGTRKLLKAQEWGIPCVRLAWLLDSIAAARLQPLGAYLVHPSAETADAVQHQQRWDASPTAVAKQQQAGGTGTCHQQPLGGRNRPSSVASNVPPAAGADAQREALAPMENVLAAQLRRMSLSPEPLASAAGQHPCDARQPQQHLGDLGWLPDSLPQQGSPAGSPAHSLSLQGMLAGQEQEQPAAAGGVAAEVCSRQPEAACSPWQQDAQSPGVESMLRQDVAQPASCSPMDQQQESPAAWAQQGSSAEQGSLSGRSARRSSRGRASPFTFSLAAALGRRVPEEMPGGSPMAMSPAAAPAPFTSGTPTTAGSTGRASGPWRGRSRLAAGAGSGAADDSQDPVCSLPTPACIRDWSDDDSLAGSPSTGDGGERLSQGITQTPPAVRLALAAGASPTQYSPPQQQQSQLQQRYGAAEDMHPTPAAVRDWSDDETVASEPGPAAELVVSDSETDSDDILAPPPCQQSPPQQSPPPQQAPAQQQQQQQQHAQQPLQPLQPLQQPRRLLQVSRQSEGRHEASAATACQPTARPAGYSSAHPAARHGMLSKHAAPSASSPPSEAAAGEAAVDTASPLDASYDGAMPSPGGFGGDLPCTASQGSSGSGGAPAAAPTASANRPTSSSSAAPTVDEHFVTSRRQQGGALGKGRQQAQQQARASARDWSDDDSDEFPTPQGRQYGGGVTGLTQLDPSSIVIARPKPSASTARWRGEAGSLGGVLGLKMLQRPPRGNAVRDHHGLPNLKTVQFAEQVQVGLAGGLILSTKDKKTAVRLQPGGLSEEEAEDDEFQADTARRSSSSSAAGGSRGGSGGSQGLAQQQAQQRQQQQGAAGEDPVLAEPQTFYRLADGSWWLEYCRFYTAAQAEAAAADQGCTMQLPQGFDRSCELLKAVSRGHAPMSDVAGGVQIRRVKQGGTMLRLRGGSTAGGSCSYFWRLAVDTQAWKVVTDRPSADFVAIE